MGEVGQTTVGDETAPLGGAGGSGSRPVPYAVTHDFTVTDCELARGVHAAFYPLSDIAKNGLRVPMQRLQNALLERRDPVDSAIDLGIALEAFLLSDNTKTEIGYRFALRGARLLATDPKEQGELYDALTSLYTTRSTAVRRGVLPTKPGKRREAWTAEQLAAGYPLAARAIRKVIELGGVEDWEDVTFDPPRARQQ